MINEYIGHTTDEDRHYEQQIEADEADYYDTCEQFEAVWKAAKELLPLNPDRRAEITKITDQMEKLVESWLPKKETKDG